MNCTIKALPIYNCGMRSQNIITNFDFMQNNTVLLPFSIIFKSLDSLYLRVKRTGRITLRYQQFEVTGVDRVTAWIFFFRHHFHQTDISYARSLKLEPNLASFFAILRNSVYTYAHVGFL